MSLHDLKREYEERRRALIEQLQGKKSLDAGTQHQIYGAIKEIENFLATIDTHQQAQQARGISVELSRERPRPFAERTQKALRKVGTGTGRVFTHHIPSATRAIVTAPKRFVDRKREESRLRREIEAEVRARNALQTAPESAHNQEYVVLEHPHQVLSAEEPSSDSQTLGELAQERPEDVPAAVDVARKRSGKRLPVRKTVLKAKKLDRTLAVPSRKNIVMGKHPKRAKTIEVPAKQKARPSRHGRKSMGKTHSKGKHLSQAPKTQRRR